MTFLSSLLIFLVIAVPQAEVNPDSIQQKSYKAQEITFGCIECHPSSLACHLDRQETELESIRKLWFRSFHYTLQKDDFEPYSDCLAFFRKGDCFYCHPNFLRRGAKEKRPHFRHL